MPKSNKNKQKTYMDYASSYAPNPGSIHEFGMETKAKLEDARFKVASLLGAKSDEIIFTSSGTESNNLAILGLIKSSKVKGLPHIITTNIEHPSVLETCKMLQKQKLARVSIVPVEPNGIIDPKKIKKEIRENTLLISVMYANNEIGTIFPINEIAKSIRHFKKHNKIKTVFPFLHVDAVQAISFLDLNVERLHVDLMTFSGAKVKGGIGVGVLYKRRNVSLEPILYGGSQEFGLRPGTPNVNAIESFASSFEVLRKNVDQRNKKLLKMRDYFVKEIKKISDQIVFNGDFANRLPNNVNITLGKIPSDLVVIELSAKGIMVSSKSACKSTDEEGSYVIEAIRPHSDKEIGGVRFSFDENINKVEIDRAVASLRAVVSKLEKWYN